MDGWMIDGWMDGWMHEYGCTDARMHDCMNGWMEGWKDGLIDMFRYGCMCNIYIYMCVFACAHLEMYLCICIYIYICICNYEILHMHIEDPGILWMDKAP